MGGINRCHPKHGYNHSEGWVVLMCLPKHGYNQSEGWVVLLGANPSMDTITVKDGWC